MGIRSGVLLKIKDVLNNLPISTINNEGNGKILHAENRTFDISTLNKKMFPLLSIIPSPHTIQIGLSGTSQDSTFRVAMFGFVDKAQNEDLVIAGENVIDIIIARLTTYDIIEDFKVTDINCNEICFSIVEIGPILNEQFNSEDGNELAYISIPLTIQFVEG
jgi:hypothetical protein